MSNNQLCELCGRQGCLLTRHHLIPRSQHRKKRVRRSHNREYLHHNVAMLCRPCHSKIHAIWTEQQLANEYHSIELIRLHPDIQSFVSWIQTKPAGFKPKR